VVGAWVCHIVVCDVVAGVLYECVVIVMFGIVGSAGGVGIVGAVGHH
jgi:hypothetical protein